MAEQSFLKILLLPLLKLQVACHTKSPGAPTAASPVPAPTAPRRARPRLSGLSAREGAAEPRGAMGRGR